MQKYKVYVTFDMEKKDFEDLMTFMMEWFLNLTKDEIVKGFEITRLDKVK